MSAEITIQKLLAEARLTADRREARQAWARKTTKTWKKMMQELDERCTGAAERMSEEEFRRFCDAELAKTDVLYVQLRAVIDEDKWPRELYWGGV